MMYFHGSLMKKGADVGLVFVLSFGVRMRYMVRIHFPVTPSVLHYKSFAKTLHEHHIYV